MSSFDDDSDSERDFDDIEDDSLEARVWQLLLLINPGDEETALQQFADMVTGVPHFVFLVVGHGHHAQREHLVHFGAIEEVARALRRDLRIVVEHDRRAQHHVAVMFVAHQYWKVADVLAMTDRLAKLVGRIQQ